MAQRADDEEDMARIIMNLKKNGYNEQLRKRATEHARGYTWKNAAKVTLEIYRRACK